MTSHGAMLNLCASGSQDKHLPPARQSSVWKSIAGRQESSGDLTYTYDIASEGGDLLDCVNTYVTIKPSQPSLLRKFSAADVVDRIYLATTGKFFDSDYEERLALFDGWVLEKDPVYHDDVLYIPLQLTSGNLPRFANSEFKLRIRFKIPVSETSLGFRTIYLDVVPRKTLFSSRTYPYMTYGSCERKIEAGSSAYMMSLDMYGSGAPITDMFLSLHDISGKAVHCIDTVKFWINNFLLFSGDQFLCRYHLPRQLYGVADKTDRYYISFAEQPQQAPGKGTVNLSRIETSSLDLQFLAKTTEEYTLRLSWRYHNVLKAQVQDGQAWTGAAFHCDCPAALHLTNMEFVGAKYYQLDSMGKASWLVVGQKGKTYSYVISEDVFDPSAAVFTVNFDKQGKYSIERKTHEDHVSDIEFLGSDRLHQKVTSIEITLVNKAERTRFLQVKEHATRPK